MTKDEGGKKRMAQLNEQERSDLATKAINERWHPTIPKATHSGILQIGDKKIECAILKMPDGTIKRVISAHSISVLMGRARPNKKEKEKAREGGVPTFLSAKNLRPFIPLEDSRVGVPLVYKNKSGSKTTGYEYQVLTIACEAYLKARDANALVKDQEDLAKSCEMLLRSFAQVGLVSLIDEASGYQEVRDRHALQALLDKYLLKEFAEWAKRFPDDFYKQIFRLNDWKFQEIVAKKPQVVGKFTNDIVYSRLLPELVDELGQRNPKDENGYRASKHHQWLNDIGNADLTAHIRGVTAIMKACGNWKEFKDLLNKIYPVKSGKDILI